MPHVVSTPKGFKVTSPDGTKVLARVRGRGRKSRNRVRVIQRRLEGQRRLILTGSKKTKLDRSIGRPSQVPKRLRRN